MHTVPRDLLDRVLDEMPSSLHQHLEAGAFTLVSVSGGADSDATAYILDALFRTRQTRWPGQFALVHAHLGRIEWPQTLPHLHELAAKVQRPLHIVQRTKGDLIARWQERYQTLLAQGKSDVPPWSSPTNRFCTAELKTSPINKLIRSLVPAGTLISVAGIRSEESPKRSHDPLLAPRKAVTTKRRLVLNYYPILSFTKNDVWRALGTSGERLAELRAQVSRLRQSLSPAELVEWLLNSDWPAHIAYPLDSTRLSCSLCIMASRRDILTAIDHNVETYRTLALMEMESGFSFQHKLWLYKLRPDLLPPEIQAQLGHCANTLQAPAQQIALF